MESRMRFCATALVAALCSVAVSCAVMTGELPVPGYSDAYFTGVLHALAGREPQTTFVRWVQSNLKWYNEKSAPGGRIRADCPAEALVPIVKGSDDEHRTRVALLLLSLRSPDECKDAVKAFFNDRSRRPFSRIYAALVLAYWGEQDGKAFLHHVLKHGGMSSSGFGYSYAWLGLYLLDDLPEDFSFSNLPDSMFGHLGKVRRR